ncbi:hypothetical protein BBJ28_00016917 [Nothophytophthora sp. Chile5]|nr:hypothetical protein BBJ28_00016917 [Nothophytophthora sp. Chile5]
MATDLQAAHVALARNLLSSVLALAFPDGLEADAAAQRAFLAQQSALQASLERHNVFGLVTEGKALVKWQSKLLQLVEAAPVVCRVGWELLLLTARQSPLERLEAMTPKLLERVLKVLKQHQSTDKQQEEGDDAAMEATAAACSVVQALLHHVERFGAETRRDTLELLSKFVPALLTVLSSKRKTSSNTALVLAVLELLATLLRVAPNALRSSSSKIEAACVSALFPSADASGNDEAVANQAAVCLALLCNASDNPHQVWTQMARKALEAAHAQLDLLAGKQSGVSTSTENVTGKKLWMLGAASPQLPVYQRAEITLSRFSRALSVFRELLSARTATQSRGQISEREAQQVLPDALLLARRALGVRAHEVGKHTGVSDDGLRLPVSVVFAVLPRVHAQALYALSSAVERTGLCALRHASKIARVLLLASESVGDGEDLQALADTTAVCVRRLGASTVEKLGVPLLNDLVARCNRSLDDKALTPVGDSNSVAKAVAAQQNDGKSGGGKSKKRKRQAAAAATLAALVGGNAASGQATFVSLHDQSVKAQSLAAALTAIAGCMSIYGTLLPATCRASASELALLAAQRRQTAGTAIGHAQAAVDPVALALLSDAVTADASGAHASNLLRGLQYWQRRAVGSGGASSAMLLAALNAGEALLHPRAPPLAINFQGPPGNEHESQAGSASKALTTAVVCGDAMDWDENGLDEDASEEEGKEDTQPQATTDSPSAQEPVKTHTVTDEQDGDDDEEEEDYDDVRPQAVETDAPMDVQEEEEEEEEEPVVKRVKDSEEEQVAAIEADDDDDDDDDFPDIVVDDAEDNE